MLGTKRLMVAINFYSTEKNTMEVNGYRQLFDYQHSPNGLLVTIGLTKRLNVWNKWRRTEF